MRTIASLVMASATALTIVALPAPAQAQTLVNLTTKKASVGAGNKACPKSDYYLYSGGKADAFAGGSDLSYPSPNLLAFIPGGGPRVDYDVAMLDGRFGDSFNLQNNRTVCHAVIEFQAQTVIGTNDGLHFGHVQAGGAPFNIVGSVIPPAAITGVQRYALDATGLALLSAQTSNSNPLDTIFDLYVQDDTTIDYFKLYVWYH